MSRIQISGFLLILLSVWGTSCKRDCDIPNDPSCRNYDPCWGKPPVSASFTMWEDVFGDTLALSRSLFSVRNLLLIADQGHESYRWQIGQETEERTGKSIVVHFAVPYDSVKITLIVSDTPDLNCNPGDDGRDTVSKTIRVLAYEDLPIWGTYRGIDTDRPDEPFTITVSLDSFLFGRIAAIRNLPEGCTVDRGITSGANGFRIEGHSGALNCYAVEGLAKLNPSEDSLRIEYTHLHPDSAYLNPPSTTRFFKTFIGTRQ